MTSKLCTGQTGAFHWCHRGFLRVKVQMFLWFWIKSSILPTSALCRLRVCLPLSRVSGQLERAHVHVWLEPTCSGRQRGERWRLLSVWCSSARACRCRLTGVCVGEGLRYVVCCWGAWPSGTCAPKLSSHSLYHHPSIHPSISDLNPYQCLPVSHDRIW